MWRHPTKRNFPSTSLIGGWIPYRRSESVFFVALVGPPTVQHFSTTSSSSSDLIILCCFWILWETAATSRMLLSSVPLESLWKEVGNKEQYWTRLKPCQLSLMISWSWYHMVTYPTFRTNTLKNNFNLRVWKWYQPTSRTTQTQIKTKLHQNPPTESAWATNVFRDSPTG